MARFTYNVFFLFHIRAVLEYYHRRGIWIDQAPYGPSWPDSWNTDILKNHWFFSALYVWTTVSLGITLSNTIKVGQVVNAAGIWFLIPITVLSNIQYRNTDEVYILSLVCDRNVKLITNQYHFTAYMSDRDLSMFYGFITTFFKYIVN